MIPVSVRFRKSRMRARACAHEAPADAGVRAQADEEGAAADLPPRKMIQNSRPILPSRANLLIRSEGNGRSERRGEGMAFISSQPLDTSAGALDRMDRAEWATAAVLHERYLKDVLRYVL